MNKQLILSPEWNQRAIETRLESWVFAHRKGALNGYIVAGRMATWHAKNVGDLRERKKSINVRRFIESVGIKSFQSSTFKGLFLNEAFPAFCVDPRRENLPPFVRSPKRDEKPRKRNTQWVEARFESVIKVFLRHRTSKTEQGTCRHPKLISIEIGLGRGRSCALVRAENEARQRTKERSSKREGKKSWERAANVLRHSIGNMLTMENS